ncbi:protein polyglycylase TTLL10-like [Heterodontus francisci]|uniref:protein polyglycylase TTLL10-like n=1 Tax=Heterodontus francisci TaxID=7792 RepID=UPI00355B2563
MVSILALFLPVFILILTGSNYILHIGYDQFLPRPLSYLGSHYPVYYQSHQPHSDPIPRYVESTSITDQKTIDNVNPRTSKQRKTDDPRDYGPFFYVGGTNGADLVVTYCENRGWKRIFDNNRGDYIFKWSEYKMLSNYQNFRPGRQLLNQIPNNRILTTKAGLCSSLKEYERIAIKYSKGVYSQVNGTHPFFGSFSCLIFKKREVRVRKWLMKSKPIKLDEFFPESYRIDVKSERQAFFDAFRDGQIWICKPSNLQEGRGIFLLRSRADVAVFRAKLESVEENPVIKPSQYNSIIHRVVQRYVVKPLLLEGRKFDVRSYFLIACTSPIMAFFHHGYAKSTCNIYDPHSDDLTSHLTNQFMQRKNPLYHGMKEETIWSMEHLNDYINQRYMQEKHLPKDWVFTVFAKRMQEIMTICFNTAKTKLDCKLGYFELLGCDFIIDQNFKVWLLEMNANPALHRHCSVLKTIIPQLLYEALDVVIEIFKKCSKGAYILPLQSQKEFVLIYGGCRQDQIPRPLRAGRASPTIVKQSSQLCPRILKRPMKKPLRKSSVTRSLSEHAAVEGKPFQKAVSLLSHGQLPVIAQIQSLCCMETKAKTNPLSRSHPASLKEWSQLQANVSKPLMMTTPFVSMLNRRFAAISQKSKSLESSLLTK